MNEDALAEQAAAAVLQGQADMGSDLEDSLDAAMEYTPRRGNAHKRQEEPPRNDEGKYICRFQNTCGNQTFERKCEWSKHMDKHERPYKCETPGCEKIQGFTYSGGLLRHQREVHKMHGGTKEPLYCPFPNCKRNQGTGFTRKENRDEHIRRVHRRATDGIDMLGQKRDSDTMDATDPLLGEALMTTHGADIGDENMDPSASTNATPAPKRRKTQTNGGVPVDAVSDEGDLKTQFKRLQESNNWLFKLTTRLAEDNSRLLERMNRLEADVGTHLLNGACGINDRLDDLQ